MNRMDDELKKAAQELAAAEPAPDADEVRRVRDSILEKLGRGLRRIERTLWIYLYICLAALFYAAHRISTSADLKIMLAFGLVLLIAFETTILMKIWYWQMSTKIGLLKELKLARLAMIGDREAGAADMLPERTLVRACSRPERLGWLVGMLAVAFIITHFFPVRGSGLAIETTPPGMACERTTTLTAEGTYTQHSRYSFLNNQAFPWDTFQLFSERELEAAFETLDGASIQSTAQRVSEGIRTTLHLPEPVMPGARLLFNSQATDELAPDDGVWEYWDGQSWGFGYGRCHYNTRVELPPGAEVIETEPEPSWRETVGERSVLVFEETLPGGGHYLFRVRYRLP